MVESIAQQGHESPQQQLLADIQYSPNPGVSLDREANYVTATDGKPVNKHSGGKTPESPGNFYLFDLEYLHAGVAAPNQNYELADAGLPLGQRLCRW